MQRGKRNFSNCYLDSLLSSRLLSSISRSKRVIRIFKTAKMFSPPIYLIAVIIKYLILNVNSQQSISHFKSGHLIVSRLTKWHFLRFPVQITTTSREHEKKYVTGKLTSANKKKSLQTHGIRLRKVCPTRL